LRDTLIITVLKPVTKKRLVKTEAFYVSCDYSDNLIVWLSDTVTITVLKPFTKKRLVKTQDFFLRVITMINGMSSSLRLL
jgi:hypothetical protein